MLWPLLIFFFFQAEDGIRDYKVTGVQTCALPIYWNQSSFPGSFTDWKMLVCAGPPGPAWTGLLAGRRGVRREAPETQPRPPAPGPGAQSAPSSRVDLVIPLINATTQSEVPRRTRWRCALEYPGRGTSDWGV